MRKILFSVVIPTYNRATFIKKTIESVLSQSYTNFEIIVVDDGSTDNTEEVVSSINDLRLFYYKKENGERGAARNYGAKKAKGEYIYFLDSDDLLYQTHLSEANDFILNNSPKVFFQQYEFTLENGLKKPNLVIPTNQFINDLLVEKGNFMSCHGVFINREIFLENQFNEDRNMAGSEDYELWLRLASRYPIMYSNIVTSTLVYHDERSVLNFPKDRLILRKELMLKALFNDDIFVQKYGKYKEKLYADAYTYISLHIALTKKYPKDALVYFYKAICMRKRIIFSRRGLAIVKYLLF